MKTLVSLFTVAALLLLAAGAFVGCKEEPPTSLYDDAAYNKASKAQPVVSSITPASGALAGVTVLTLAGQNFSTVPKENLVFFDATVATVQQATATQLTLVAPTMVKDSIKVRVSVLGADQISSPPLLYKLDAAVSVFGNIGSGSEPFAITCDAAGNVYVALTTNNVAGGVKRIAANGTSDPGLYVPVVAGVLKWTGLKFGAGGVLYASGVAGLNGVMYQIPAGGGTPTPYVGFGRVQVYDFDIDANGNMWVGGNMPNIIRVLPSKATRNFPFAATLRSLRVFGPHLYVGGRVDTVEGVWRFPLAGDTLGTVEKYYDLSANYPGGRVNGITFAQDGDMFIATNTSANSLLLVHPNKNAETFYPGLLSQENTFLTYSNGAELYLSRTGPATDGSDKRVIKVNTQKQGAPYYGR